LRRPSCNHVGSSQPRDVLGTQRKSFSNPTTSHETSSNTRSTNLNELMYVKYSNAANNNLNVDELLHHFRCDSTMMDGPDQDNEVSSGSPGEFFEGVEKLLEVWFTTQSGNTENCDLRRIPRDQLEKMLRKVKCEIMSACHNAQLDAYVLSESSMFVSKRRFILKTCGRTTPLECLLDLNKLVKVYTGFDTIEDIFYSRKNFSRPELQLKPHRCFEQEVAILDGMFSDGAAYCMGTLNRDCWYLYTLNPLDKYLSGHVDVEPDQTIEILMQDLDPKIMEKFSKKNVANGKEATLVSGINKIIPSMKIDDFLFEPCGYSMNGILKNENIDFGLGEYMTIHITPEPDFSYVSFESNIPLASYSDMIQRVLDTFLPGKFVLTIFANRTSMAADSHKELQKSVTFGNWVRKDIQYSQFQNYELTYAHFVRFPTPFS